MGIIIICYGIKMHINISCPISHMQHIPPSKIHTNNLILGTIIAPHNNGVIRCHNLNRISLVNFCFYHLRNTPCITICCIFRFCIAISSIMSILHTLLNSNIIGCSTWKPILSCFHIISELRNKIMHSPVIGHRSQSVYKLRK